MGLKKFERRLENLVEGTFARVFRSGLAPLEISRRIGKEIEANRAVNDDGIERVANYYWVYVSTPDYERFKQAENELCDELANAARSQIRELQLGVIGDIKVQLVEADNYPEGAVQVQAQWVKSPLRVIPATLVTPDGYRSVLNKSPFDVGRAENNDFVILDANVSRNHSRFICDATGWTVIDLDSTNGTSLNGKAINTAPVEDGDHLLFGNVAADFEY